MSLLVLRNSAVCWLFLASGVLATPAQRPNIVYINADDLGVMDVGFNSDRYNTPNIDRLRRDGMLFTNAYAPAANCAPSRAGVLSGQWGPRHGVYTVGNSDRGRSRDRKLIPTKNQKHLSPENLTFVEILRRAGYRTIHLGKWHLSDDPTRHGFEVNVGGSDSGGPSGGGYFSPFPGGPMKPLSDQYPVGTHRVDIFADQAIDFMRQHRDEPFFVQMAYYSVHNKLEPVPEFIDRYKDGDVNATYASMIEKMDQGIGKLLDELDSLGLAEQTLVLFTSDNGGVRATSDQSPYRAGKGSYFEGGIREPMVVRWPGHVAPGRTSDVPVTGLDFYPTFLEAAGVQPPSGQVLDGTSLLPILTGSGDIPPRPLFWHFPIYLQAYAGAKDDSHDRRFRTRPGSVVRLGEWKLHQYFEDGRVELYNLDRDIGERNDVSSQNPVITDQLRDTLQTWREEVNAPVPTRLNPNYIASP